MVYTSNSLPRATPVSSVQLNPRRRRQQQAATSTSRLSSTPSEIASDPIDLTDDDQQQPQQQYLSNSNSRPQRSTESSPSTVSSAPHSGGLEPIPTPLHADNMPNRNASSSKNHLKKEPIDVYNLNSTNKKTKTELIEIPDSGSEAHSRSKDLSTPPRRSSRRVTRSSPAPTSLVKEEVQFVSSSTAQDRNRRKKSAQSLPPSAPQSEAETTSSQGFRRSKRAAAKVATANLTSDKDSVIKSNRQSNQNHSEISPTDNDGNGDDKDDDKDDDNDDDDDDEDESSSDEVIKRGNSRVKAERDDDDKADDEDEDEDEDENHDDDDDDDDDVEDVMATGPRRRTRTTADKPKGNRRVTRQMKSVPLPKPKSLQERLKSRKSLSMSFTGIKSPNANTTAKKNMGKRKRTAQNELPSTNKRKRGSHPSRRVSLENDDDDEDEDEDEDVDEVMPQGQIRFLVEGEESDVEGSIARSDQLPGQESADSDEEVESEDDEDDEDAPMELQDTAEDEDEDENEEDEDEDEEEEEEEDEEEEMRPVRRRRRKRASPKSQRRKNNSSRRKRTEPSDVFGANPHELSAEEQQGRLDFLVTQTAKIASTLHKTLAGGGEDKVNEENPSRKEEKFQPPNGEGCQLQPHQFEGVNWLLTLDARGLNAILADEMGLGKTIQAISFLASLVISGSRGPHLVIAPKNVCEHWVDEVQKFYPGQLSVVAHLGPAEERLDHLDKILEEDNFDIMVTSYEIALRDLFMRKKYEGLPSHCTAALREFRKVEFEYLVVDEAQRLKNDNSRMNIAIRNYKNVQRRLLLTGTPLSNNLKELWSLMNILNPTIFSSKATFESWFSAPFENMKGKKRTAMNVAEKSVIVDRLHTIIRPFFRRRDRKDICAKFTSADEVIIHCPMSMLQKALMYHFQRRASEREAGVTNILMTMREVSNHPFTATDAFDEGDNDDFAQPKLVALSGKFSFLHYALPRLVASGHRVLIFSQFRTVLDFLEDLLEILDIRYGRLDGTTKSEERVVGIAEFNASDSEIPIFLLTTRAGGVGLNLQTADTVILFDSDWNPSADLQAVSRIQRIGQKRTVHILRLVTEDSVDALIVEVAEHKRQTQTVAVEAGKFGTTVDVDRDQKLRQKDLEDLLEKLETKKYEDDNGEVTANAEVSIEAKHKACLENWDKKLLRVGETELKTVDVKPIFVDSTPDSGAAAVPIWLKKDADLVAASRAIRCNDQAEAVRMYEKTIQSRAQVGAFSKQDRAKRACRNALQEYSDADSEGEEGFNLNRRRAGSDDDEFEGMDIADQISDSDDDGDYDNISDELGYTKTKSKSKFATWNTKNDDKNRSGFDDNLFGKMVKGQVVIDDDGNTPFRGLAAHGGNKDGTAAGPSVVHNLGLQAGPEHGLKQLYQSASSKDEVLSGTKVAHSNSYSAPKKNSKKKLPPLSLPAPQIPQTLNTNKDVIDLSNDNTGSFLFQHSLERRQDAQRHGSQSMQQQVRDQNIQDFIVGNQAVLNNQANRSLSNQNASIQQPNSGPMQTIPPVKQFYPFNPTAVTHSFFRMPEPPPPPNLPSKPTQKQVFPPQKQQAHLHHVKGIQPNLEQIRLMHQNQWSNQQFPNVSQPPLSHVPIQPNHLPTYPFQQIHHMPPPQLLQNPPPIPARSIPLPPVPPPLAQSLPSPPPLPFRPTPQRLPEKTKLKQTQYQTPVQLPKQPPKKPPMQLPQQPLKQPPPPKQSPPSKQLQMQVVQAPGSSKSTISKPTTKPKQPAKSNYIVLPLMNSNTGKVDLMKIIVPLQGETYNRVLTMSSRALSLANKNDRLGASALCTKIAEVLENWNGNEENKKPQPSPVSSPPAKPAVAQPQTNPTNRVPAAKMAQVTGGAPPLVATRTGLVNKDQQGTPSVPVSSVGLAQNTTPLRAVPSKNTIQTPMASGGIGKQPVPQGQTKVKTSGISLSVTALNGSSTHSAPPSQPQPSKTVVSRESSEVVSVSTPATMSPVASHMSIATPQTKRTAVPPPTSTTQARRILPTTFIPNHTQPTQVSPVTEQQSFNSTPTSLPLSISPVQKSRVQRQSIHNPSSVPVIRPPMVHMNSVPVQPQVVQPTLKPAQLSPGLGGVSRNAPTSSQHQPAPSVPSTNTVRTTRVSTSNKTRDTTTKSLPLLQNASQGTGKVVSLFKPVNQASLSSTRKSGKAEVPSVAIAPLKPVTTKIQPQQAQHVGKQQSTAQVENVTKIVTKGTIAKQQNRILGNNVQAAQVATPQNVSIPSPAPLVPKAKEPERSTSSTGSKSVSVSPALTISASPPPVVPIPDTPYSRQLDALLPPSFSNLDSSGTDGDSDGVRDQLHTSMEKGNTRQGSMTGAPAKRVLRSNAGPKKVLETGMENLKLNHGSHQTISKETAEGSTVKVDMATREKNNTVSNLHQVREQRQPTQLQVSHPGTSSKSPSTTTVRLAAQHQQTPSKLNNDQSGSPPQDNEKLVSPAMIAYHHARLQQEAQAKIIKDQIQIQLQRRQGLQALQQQKQQASNQPGSQRVSSGVKTDTRNVISNPNNFAFNSQTQQPPSKHSVQTKDSGNAQVTGGVQGSSGSSSRNPNPAKKDTKINPSSVNDGGGVGAGHLRERRLSVESRKMPTNMAVAATSVVQPVTVPGNMQNVAGQDRSNMMVSSNGVRSSKRAANQVVSGTVTRTMKSSLSPHVKKTVVVSSPLTKHSNDSNRIATPVRSGQKNVVGDVNANVNVSMNQTLGVVPSSNVSPKMPVVAHQSKSIVKRVGSSPRTGVSSGGITKENVNVQGKKLDVKMGSTYGKARQIALRAANAAAAAAPTSTPTSTPTTTKTKFAHHVVTPIAPPTAVATPLKQQRQGSQGQGPKSRKDGVKKNLSLGVLSVNVAPRKQLVCEHCGPCVHLQKLIDDGIITAEMIRLPLPKSKGKGNDANATQQCGHTTPKNQNQNGDGNQNR